jgi:hypothetical protein
MGCSATECWSGPTAGNESTLWARASFYGRQTRSSTEATKHSFNRASTSRPGKNALVIWDTRHLAAGADRLAQHGHAVADSVWSYLSPLH